MNDLRNIFIRRKKFWMDTYQIIYLSTHSIFKWVITVGIFDVLLDRLLRIHKNAPKSQRFLILESGSASIIPLAKVNIDVVISLVSLHTLYLQKLNNVGPNRLIYTTRYLYMSLNSESRNNDVIRIARVFSLSSQFCLLVLKGTMCGNHIF